MASLFLIMAKVRCTRSCSTHLAERKRKVVYVVDPKKENYGSYRFPTLVTPNKAEASEASGIAIVDEATLSLAGAALLRKWRAQAVLITRGAEGMSLFRPGRR